MTQRPPLSSYPAAKAWLSQFGAADQSTAAKLLDALLLLSEEQVSDALRTQLYALADTRHGRRRRIALYAEREFGDSPIFKSELVRDAGGRLRRRAVGRRGPDPVKPVRGSGRVGSEGLVAFVISQAVGTRPHIFMNHPGPDLIRGKTAPPGTITIVTDFIGSGSRVRGMLDAFWKVPTIRAWVSRGRIDFKVIAAAATSSGSMRVRQHRLRPEVHFQHATPTIRNHSDWHNAHAWLELISRYGPDAGRGTSRYGFGGDAALIAFNYRLPNNTPAMLHSPGPRGWRPLYESEAPNDLRPAFGLRTRQEVVDHAAAETGVPLAADLSSEEAEMVLILSLLRGRWRKGTEVGLAERTGIAVPNILDLLGRALKTGLVTRSGRLTDAGQALVAAGRQDERRRPTVPTNPTLYYPLALRIPRGSPRTRRPSGRP